MSKFTKPFRSSGHSSKRERRDDMMEEDEMVEEERSLSAVSPDDGDNETCRTFLFKGEGHTLGNSLRFVISTYPEVLFCAYTLPHPAEDVMHFRIQTAPGISPQQILQRGLHDLLKLSEVVIDKFEDAMANAPPLTIDEDETLLPHAVKSEPPPSRSSSKGSKSTAQMDDA